MDRSPTGSGVAARVAFAHARGGTAAGDRFVFESLTGAQFGGEAVSSCPVGTLDAVAVAVSGRAHYSGAARFTMEPDDPLAGGFRVR